MEGINGIETAKALRKSHGKEKETILIFVTGIREYVFDAFDVSAFHYLLKPVEEEKFSEVFGRAVEEIENRKRQKRSSFLSKVKGLSWTKAVFFIWKAEAKGCDPYAQRNSGNLRCAG